MTNVFLRLGLVVLAVLGSGVVIMIRDRIRRTIPSSDADQSADDNRVRRPQIDELEKHFRSTVPADMAWLYSSGPVTMRNVHIRSELQPDHEYEIDRFLPADVKNVEETWFDIGDGRFPFAIDGFGNYFLIDMKPQSPTPVFYVDHDGGSVWPVAHSLRSWLADVGKSQPT